MVVDLITLAWGWCYIRNWGVCVCVCMCRCGCGCVFIRDSGVPDSEQSHQLHVIFKTKPIQILILAIFSQISTG